MGFERARQPEQVAQRRQSIFDATRTLFEEVGFDDTRLVDIGERAGVSKATVYRYFETKEAILLELLVEETEAWVQEIESELAALRGAGHVDAVAGVVAGTLAGRPRLCSLSAKVSSVLEKNVSADVVRSFKRRTLALTIRLVNALHAALPSLSVEGAQRFVGIIVTYQNGLYPLTHPPPSTQSVLEEKEFAPFRVDHRDAVFETSRLLLDALTSD